MYKDSDNFLHVSFTLVTSFLNKLIELLNYGLTRPKKLSHYI